MDVDKIKQTQSGRRGNMRNLDDLGSYVQDKHAALRREAEQARMLRDGQTYTVASASPAGPTRQQRVLINVGRGMVTVGEHLQRVYGAQPVPVEGLAGSHTV
jgi:hypothetical protein